MDYFLWGFLKDQVYVNSPGILEELEVEVRRILDLIHEEMLKKVMDNFIKRLQYVVVAEGAQFENIIN